MPSPIPFYTFIIICMPIQFVAYASDYDQKHFTDCAPFKCGDISEISYPFRLLGGSDYCGHPGFEVECVRIGLNAYLLMTIGSVKYEVNSIAWEKQRLNIARPDLYSDLCPKLKQNDTTLDHSLFDYAPGSENATLYYDCKQAWNQDPYRFSCDMMNAARDGYLSFYKPGLQHKQLELSKDCNHSIRAPLLERPAPQPSRPELMRDNIIAALNKGFEVTWKVDMQQCRSCNISGGRCGHNTSTLEFNCFCPDGVHPKECTMKVDMQQCRSCNSSGTSCGHDNTTQEFKCFNPEGAHQKEWPQHVKQTNPSFACTSSGGFCQHKSCHDHCLIDYGKQGTDGVLWYQNHPSLRHVQFSNKKKLKLAIWVNLRNLSFNTQFTGRPNL